MSSFFLFFILLAGYFVPLASVPLLDNVRIIRPEQNAVNITASGINVANANGSNHKVFFALNVNIDTSNNLFALDKKDNFGVSYGPSDWNLIQSLDADLNGWIVQSTAVTQLIVNPVSLAVAQSPYRGTHLMVGESTWSDIVIEVDVRSQTPEDKEPHSTGITWRALDEDNHYMFVINVDCGFTKVVRVRNRNQELIATGPTVLVKDYNFGSRGRIPVVTDTNEFAYILGTSLSTCEGSCQIDTDCPGSLTCYINTEEDGKIPGCEGLGTEGWGYCILPRHRPPEDSTTTGFLIIDDSAGLNGASDMLQCQGDCDYDRDCLGNLVCIMREEKTSMPGCSGKAVDFWDYCGRQESEPVFVKDDGPGMDRYAAHDGYAITFQNKDSTKTSAYIFHVESQSKCASDADADILDGGYKICAWVKVGTNYNGVHQVLATSFWDKKQFVGHTSTLNHCNADETCQFQSESALPFQQNQRNKWHYVCDMFVSKSNQISSMDIFIGYPVRASQGILKVTGITIERRAINSVNTATALNLIGMTKSEAANFRYRLRVSNVQNKIQVELNGELYISVQDTSAQAFVAGKIGLFSSGNVNTGFRNLGAYPIKGSAELKGPAVNNFRLPLVNESSNVTEVVGSRVLLMLQGCPPSSSTESCGDYQTFVMSPPDPPKVHNFLMDEDGENFQVALDRPVNDGGSIITHYEVWYCLINETTGLVGPKSRETIVISDQQQNTIIKSFGPIVGGHRSELNFGAAGCSHVGCGNEAGLATSPPTIPQNLTVALTDSNEELLLTVGFPSHTGGIPITHYIMETYPLFDETAFDACQGADSSSIPPAPTWEVTWNNGVPEIFPTIVDGKEGMKSIAVTNWNQDGKTDYFNHIIAGPRGPNTAVDTEYGSCARLSYNNRQGYKFKNDADYTINAITRGPFKYKNDWHTLSRGEHRDHHFIVHPRHNTAHGQWKMGYYKNSNPNRGFNAFVNKDNDNTFMDKIFGGTDGNDPYDQGGIWKYLTIVSKQGTMTYYIDGELMGTFVTDGTIASSQPYGGIRSIGCHGNNAQKWGPLASFTFWDFALSEEEIKKIKLLKCSEFGNEQIRGSAAAKEMTCEEMGRLLVDSSKDEKAPGAALRLMQLKKYESPCTWTLAAQIDGNLDTFDYDKAIWTDTSTLDAGGEKKTAAFNDMKSSGIRIEFERGECTQQFDYIHNLNKTLRDIFSGGEIIDASPGRNAWIGLGCGIFARQTNCNRHGFNVVGGSNKIRYGIIFNNENNCGSPDASIGLGIKRDNIAAGGQYGCCNQADSLGKGMDSDQIVMAKIYVMVKADPSFVPPEQRPTPIEQYVVTVQQSNTDTVPYRIIIQACNYIFCGSKHKVGLNVPNTPLSTILSVTGAPSEDNLQVNVVDGSDGGLPILNYKIQFMREVEILQHIPCDTFTGGQPCLKTYRSTDADTCKANGLNILVPRSEEHWEYLTENYMAYMQTAFVGVSRPTNGVPSAQRRKPMNSVQFPPATSADAWQAIDGGPWFLSSKASGEPNGDYGANCWLSVKNQRDVTNLGYNDGTCSYASSKYLCSNNMPQEFTEPDPSGKAQYSLVEEMTKTKAELVNPIYMEFAGSRPFMVHVYPCNQFGCSITPGVSSTKFPPAPEKVAVRVTGPNQLSLSMVADPSIAGTNGLEFEINIQNKLWLDYVTVPDKWFSVSFNQGLIEASDNNIIAAGDGNGFVGIVGPGSDNLVSGVDSWQSDSLTHLGFNKLKALVSDVNPVVEGTECEGDCDNDGECSGTLICFQRSGIADVPGCLGKGKSDWDYCHDPSWVMPPLGTTWTISAWVKFDEVAGGNNVLSKINTAQVLLAGDTNSAKSEYVKGPADSPIMMFVPSGTDITNNNVWTMEMNSQSITANVGATVTQGTATGTLKTALTGASTSVEFTTALSVAFVDSENIIVGGTTVVVADINSLGSVNPTTQDSRQLGYWSNADQQFYTSGILAGDFNGEWQNLGVITSNGIQKFYLDGVYKGSTTRAFSGTIKTLGGVDGQVNYRWGAISTLTVWNSALTEEELQSSLNIAVINLEQQTVAAGTTSLSITNPVFTQNPMKVSVFCKTFLGTSYKATSMNLWTPTPPVSATLRVVNAGSINFIIVYPNNDGGANVIHWKVVMTPPTTDAFVNINHIDGHVGAVALNSNDVGTLPRAFAIYSCSLLGCSPFPQTIHTKVPDAPVFFNIVNHATQTLKFEIQVGLPIKDGGADHDSYMFVATCFPDGQASVTSSITNVLGDMTLIEESGLYTILVSSPITTNNTCKVDAHACSVVGCSTEMATSWNIGLNSVTTATLVDLKPPSNITLKFLSNSEPRKDINPITTELRWVHYVNEDTFATTTDVVSGTSFIRGNFPTAFTWSSTYGYAIVLDVFMAGSLLHQIERRHCYNTLCGDWLEILVVEPRPIPGIPTCPQQISVVTGFGCLSTIANPVGGEVHVEWLPPDFWGENSIQNGRAYSVTVSTCDPSSATECIFQEFSPSITYQTTDVYYDVPNLLASKRYQFRVNALNGNSHGGYTELSEIISPKVNKPSEPLVPILKVANPEAVTLDFQIPRMHGAAVFDCDMAFGIVGACGVAAAEFTDFRQFAVGLKSWPFELQPSVIYNLGLMYEFGTNAKKIETRANIYYQKAADLEHINAQKKLDILNKVVDAEAVSDVSSVLVSPVLGFKTDQWLTKNKKHSVTINGLKDDTTYSVKLRCRNEFGIGQLSSYSIPFHTPKIITTRNISVSSFFVPKEEYLTKLKEWSIGKTTSDFFGRFPVTFGTGTAVVTYTQVKFCRTHPNQCNNHYNNLGSQPFSYITTAFNNTRGESVKKGWYFGQGDDRYCQKEFPKATCRSLSKAIQATLFDGVTFFIGKGVYRHRGNGTISLSSTEFAPAQIADDLDSGLDSDSDSDSTNSTNFTVVEETWPILHFDEHFPIIFPKVGSQLVAMDNLKPSDVLLDCGGNLCFDFTPSLIENNNHPFVRLQGITITGGHAGSNGGAAIYSPKIKMQEWKYNNLLQSVIVIQSCIFQNHTSNGEGGVIHIFSESIVQNWQIHNSTFVNNKAMGSGGAIKVDSSVILLSHVHFESNTASSWGGCLRATSDFVGSAVRVIGLRSLNNVAGIGGGVFSVLGANIDVKDLSHSTNDKALGRDGGGFLVAEASTIKVANSTMKNMQATTGDGGVFNVMGSIVELKDLKMYDTSAKLSGGALTAQLCTLKIDNTQIFGAHVTGTARDKTSGGALALFIRTRCSITNSNFTSNTAPFAGGAITCDGCTSLDIEKSQFFHNTAGRGGAISCLGPDGGRPVNIMSGNFENNAAVVAGGGAIFWERWPPPLVAGKHATLRHINGILASKNHSLILQKNNDALYGNFIASGPTNIYFERSDLPIAMNTKPFGPHLTLRDNYTNQVIDTDDGISIKLRAACDTAPGFGESLALVSPQGDASFPEFGIAGQPSGMRPINSPHTVTASASEASVDSVTFEVVIQDCYQGEFLRDVQGAYACTKCLVGLFETKINQMKCTECEAGKYQDELGAKECKDCPVGLFQSKKGQTQCGNPDIVPWYPVVTNLTRTRSATNDYHLLLTWIWPAEAEIEMEKDGISYKLPSKPMVEISTKADFNENFRGKNANLSVVIDFIGKNSAVVHLPVPVYDLVVYTRVRINSGTAVGEWSSLLDPYELTSDCTDEFFLNDLGDRFLIPDRWICEKCPHGSHCLGDIRWNQVYSKFGFWRVDALTEIEDENDKNKVVLVDDPTVPDFFQECLFQAACFGAENSLMAGKYYNLSKGEELTEDTEDLALSDKGETCNWKWGHSHMCDEYGNDEKVRCRLCQNCRQGYKRYGRARCKVCPESTANRILLGFGVLGVICGFYSVVYMSINSAGTEAEVSEAVKKVIINFLQICSLAALFPLKWPPAIEAIFALMSAVSSPAQHILSPDCELSWMSGAEAFYQKQIGYAIMPIFVVLCCIILWALAYCCNAKKLGRSRDYYYDRIVLTVVCILFLLYPTMVKQSLSSLACEKVGTVYYLAVDLQEVCYVTRHAWFVLIVTIPQIVLYTIGLPVMATLILHRNRFNLTDRRVQFRMGILYHGYRPRLYWWELTIAMRKVVLVLIAGIYGVRLGPDMQVTVALMLVMLFTASHLVFSPFAADDQRALPEIPFEIREAQRMKAKEAKNVLKSARLVQKGKKKALTKSETEFIAAHCPETGKKHTMNDLVHAVSMKDVKDTLHKARTKWREFYFFMISKTNMHMLEFGSLACCAFTLWAGLVFFLNDQKPRMTRFWTEVFSVAVAAINIIAILWMMLKYILAIIREAHTREIINVWVKHAFDKSDRTKGQDMWRSRMKKVNKNKVLAVNGPARQTITAMNQGGEDLGYLFDDRTPGGRTPGGFKMQRSWVKVDVHKLQAISHAAAVMQKYEGSEERKRKKLQRIRKTSQARLKSRLSKKKMISVEKQGLLKLALRSAEYIGPISTAEAKAKDSASAHKKYLHAQNKLSPMQLKRRDSIRLEEKDKDVADMKIILLEFAVNPEKMKKILVRLDTENTKSLSQGEFHFFVGAACKHAKKPINEVIFKKVWNTIQHDRIGDHDEITEITLQKWLFAGVREIKAVNSAVTTEMADSSSEDEDNAGRNEIDEDVADIKKIMLRLVVNPNKMKKIFVRLDRENTKSLSQGEFHFFVAAACKQAKREVNEVIFKKVWDTIQHDRIGDHDEITEITLQKWLFAGVHNVNAINVRRIAL